MASAVYAEHDVSTQKRVKKTAKPVSVRIRPAQVVARLYDVFPDDMARLAE